MDFATALFWVWSCKEKSWVLRGHIALVPEDDMTQQLYLGQQRLNATVGFFEGLLTEKDVLKTNVLLGAQVVLILCVILDNTGS